MFRMYHNDESENYPPHWHSNPEIIMPLAGNYTVKLHDITYTLQEGDIIYISSGTIHQLLAPPTGERLIFQPDYSLISNLPEFASFSTILSPAVLIRHSDDPKLSAHLQDLMHQMETEYFGNSILSGASLYSMLIEMLVIIGRRYSSLSSGFEVSHDKQLEYAEKFVNICEYINEHFAEDLTLDGVASLSGFSKFHFTRLFKQFTGKTFYRYVNLKRIENAEKLLTGPSITITEVAFRSGYASLPAFVRMFKLIKGYTPTEYRKLKDSWKN